MHKVSTDDHLAEIPAIIGPTCSGKSGLAMRLAERWPVAIVNIDAAQMFRYLDIGTAKPSRAEQEKVPHYCIDVIDPDKRYSIWNLMSDLPEHLLEIERQKRCPLLVGGSMFYFLALMTGLPDSHSNLAARQRVEKLTEQYSAQQLHEQLQHQAPDLASKIHPNDSFRVARALERTFGRDKAEAEGRTYPLKSFFLAPPDRCELDQPIRQRTEAFLEAGFVDEVRQLLTRWPLNEQHHSMRLVGYRQIFNYLRGDFDRAQLADRIFYATRSLCKRQYTWMRSGRIQAQRFNAPEQLEARLDRVIAQHLERQPA